MVIDPPITHQGDIVELGMIGGVRHHRINDSFADLLRGEQNVRVGLFQGALHARFREPFAVRRFRVENAVGA